MPSVSFLIRRRRRLPVREAGRKQQILGAWQSLRHGEIWELVKEGGIATCFLFLIGGLWKFESRLTQCLYQFVFVTSFLACGCMCFLNCVAQEPPFHNLPADFLTAYVHVPITHSWLFWRHFITADHFHKMESILAAYMGKDGAKREFVITVLSRCAWLSVMAMLFVGGLVEFGYATPASRPNDEFSKFHIIHGATMWPAIPFVVCGLLVCYGCIVLVASMHYVDMIVLETHLVQEVNYYNQLVDEVLQEDGKGAKSDMPPHTPITKVAAKDIATIVRRKPAHHIHGAKHTIKECGFHSASDLSDENVKAKVMGMQLKRAVGVAFDELLERVTEKAGLTQERLTETCEQLSGSLLHLLVFSTAQLVLVSENFEAHSVGELREVTYRFEWFLGDMFHLITAVVLMVVNLGAGVAINQKINAVIKNVIMHSKMTGMPASKRAILIMQLQQLNTGFTVFHVKVSPDMVVQFVWAQILLAWSTLSGSLAVPGRRAGHR